MSFPFSASDLFRKKIVLQSTALFVANQGGPEFKRLREGNIY